MAAPALNEIFQFYNSIVGITGGGGWRFMTDFMVSPVGTCKKSRVRLVQLRQVYFFNNLILIEAAQVPHKTILSLQSDFLGFQARIFN